MKVRNVLRRQVTYFPAGHMRIFLYEFATGGGILGERNESAPPSLLREGGAMIAALAEDFLAIGADVFTLRDGNIEVNPARSLLVTEDFAVQKYAASKSKALCCTLVHTPEDAAAGFDRLAASCDWSVVIAPESEGHLLDRCRHVEEVGGRLLGPGLATVELAADKHTTAEHLRKLGVATPAGCAVESGERLPQAVDYPAVVKPRFGAGSQQVRLVRSAAEASRVLAEIAGPGGSNIIVLVLR